MPEDQNQPLTVEVKLQYRKFDTIYMNYIFDTNYAKGAPLKVTNELGADCDPSPGTKLRSRSRGRTQTRRNWPRSPRANFPTFPRGNAGMITGIGCAA